MLRELHQALSPVRMRQRIERTGQWLVVGGILGAVVGLGIEIARLVGQVDAHVISWLFVLAGGTLGGLVGFVAPVAWSTTARLIDQHYKLQDRTITALAFARRENADQLVHLQMADALERLQMVKPNEVVPYRIPKSLAALASMLTLMLGLQYVPRSLPTIDPTLAVLQQVVSDQAVTLEETMLEDLQQLVEKHPEPELKDLKNELEQLVDELKSPDVDQREALAKISEMQQSLAAALEKLDLQQVDAQLQQLATALEPAESMKALAEALKAGKYDKAAEQLEKVELKDLDRKQRDAVAANLKKFQKDLGDGQVGELSDAVQEIQEGIENENVSQCKQGQCKAASVCKKQGLKKSIAQCLNCQLNRLSQCKCNCQNPSQCSSQMVAKSDEPSKQAGMAASNQPLGDKSTSIDSQRQHQDLTGIQGEGPSEREVSSSPEGEQKSARTYNQRYAEFRKQMEEVLDSEPLPLGHRETVRKYFESIRP